MREEDQILIMRGKENSFLHPVGGQVETKDVVEKEVRLETQSEA